MHSAWVIGGTCLILCSATSKTRHQLKIDHWWYFSLRRSTCFNWTTSCSSSVASKVHVIACMRDGAGANGVAVRTLSILYTNLMEHLEIPIVNEFVSLWISMFSYSPMARLQETGTSIRTYSATRWWSKWEVMQQLTVMFIHFSSRQVFLHQQILNSKVSSTIRLEEYISGLCYCTSSKGHTILRVRDRPLCLMWDFCRYPFWSQCWSYFKETGQAHKVRGVRENQMKRYPKNAIQPELDCHKW